MRKTAVKIFSAWTPGRLQADINKWLGDHEIISISYCTVFSSGCREGYSALVHYAITNE